MGPSYYSQLNMDRKIMFTAMLALFLQREQLELFYLTEEKRWLEQLFLV